MPEADEIEERDGATRAGGEADEIEKRSGAAREDGQVVTNLNLDDLLPKDAPPDSAAHQKVKVKRATAGGRVDYGFKLNDIFLQCSNIAAGGNAEAAARIARLCFVQAENGESKD